MRFKKSGLSRARIRVCTRSRCLRDHLASAASRSVIFTIPVSWERYLGLCPNLPAYSSRMIDRANLGNMGWRKQGARRSTALQRRAETETRYATLHDGKFKFKRHFAVKEDA